MRWNKRKRKHLIFIVAFLFIFQVFSFTNVAEEDGTGENGGGFGDPAGENGDQNTTGDGEYQNDDDDLTLDEPVSTTNDEARGSKKRYWNNAVPDLDLVSETISKQDITSTEKEYIEETSEIPSRYSAILSYQSDDDPDTFTTEVDDGELKITTPSSDASFTYLTVLGKTIEVPEATDEINVPLPNSFQYDTVLVKFWDPSGGEVARYVTVSSSVKETEEDDVFMFSQWFSSNPFVSLLGDLIESG